MAGYIETRKLKSGKRYYPVIVFEGKRRYNGSYKVKKDAESHLRRLESEVANGSFGEPKKKALTFGEWVEIWMVGKTKSLKPSSLASYESTFRLHILPFFEQKKLIEIDSELISEWVDYMCGKNISAKRRKVRKLSSATINRTYRYLRSCLRTAYARGHIQANPCVGIDLPRVEKGQLVFLRPDEVYRLLEAAEWPEHVLFSILAYSGLRLGEGLALRWKHIDFVHKTIVVEFAYSRWGGIASPKTKSSVRAVPLLPTLSEVLKDHYQRVELRSPEDLLFSHDGEIPMDQSNVRKKFEKALKSAGLEHVTIHSLRHTFATTLIGCGGSVKAVQSALGHSTAQITLDVYSHLLSADLGDAALRVDALLSNPSSNVVDLFPAGNA